ncbi:phage head-tail joining protein [Methylobacterium gnaphalii]|uniref:Uncharacterized protein n=1 Tax=Methylobacterium gnaphalii TaxID=1010610 RepID=A0A512JIN5_9HYPH|nr:hypothetical protein [Methylobacterium gnaphalii]GEP09820.1 hypothetical protein MGN01_16650 [Methylobacterium gnaphalii]GJD67265.1 hypothetical protein MMMDOFMJ_0179 [Methylobacterium gnaphalii]GLS49850.1 hypothetical protein GCM10007885_27020 [Methylobacterium gnaphalii]
MAVDYSVQIAAIQAALASGTTSVSYEGKSASYRSFDEMLKVIAYLERQQARANGQPVATVGLASFDRGYHHRGHR